MTPPASPAVRKAHTMTREDVALRRAAPNLCGLLAAHVGGIPLAGCHDIRSWFVDGRQRVEATWTQETDTVCPEVASTVGDADCDLEVAPAMGGAVRVARGRVAHWTRTNGTVGLRFVEL